MKYDRTTLRFLLLAHDCLLQFIHVHRDLGVISHFILRDLMAREERSALYGLVTALQGALSEMFSFPV